MASLLMVSMNFPRLHSSARLAYLSLRLSASLRPDLPSVPKPPDPPEPPDPPDLPSFQICVVLASLLTSSPLNITHLLSPPLTAAHRVLPSVFIPHRVKDPEAHLHLSLVKATPVAKYPPPRSLDPFSPLKRNGYLSWDDYFMAIAFLSAERSKDPNRQVGACLVSQNGVILGIGYNGFPRGCSDDKLPWAKKSRTGDPLETKYPYVCHAEVNAILNTNHASAAGQKLYVTMFPCNECAKIILQSGVAEVIYFVEKRLNDSDVAYVASHKLLSMANVKVRKHQPEMDQILIKFEEHLLQPET